MKASRLLPLFGVLAVALIVAAGALSGETPDGDASISKVVAYYTKHDSDVFASGIVLMAAAAAFLAWSVQARSALLPRDAGAGTRTTLGFAGSVIFAIGVAIFAGLNIALGDYPEKLSPTTLETLNVLNAQLFPPLALGTFLTLLGYGLAVIATRAFPVWLGWIAVVGAIITFTPAWFVPFLALGLLVLVSSVMLVMRGDAPAPL